MRSLNVALIAVFLSFQVCASAVIPCRDGYTSLAVTTERIAEIPVRLRRIPRRATGDKPLLTKDIFPEDAVLLQAADYEHYAVHVGGLRYDPQAMRPARTQGPNPEATVPTGIFFYFPDLPAERVRALKEAMLREPATTSVTCVHGSCRALEEAGLFLKEGGRTPTEQADTLLRILRGGFVDKEGAPVRMEIFVNSEKSADEILKLFEFSDKRYHRAFRIHARKLGGAKQVIDGIRAASGVDLVTEQIVIDALAEQRD